VRDRDDLSVLDQLHAVGLALEGCDRRREEGLPVGEADHQRALEPRAHEQAGMGAVDDDEGEVTFQIGIGGSHSLDEITLVVTLDQVRDDLGVGLRRERVVLGKQ
jgi:hypothetical protein